MRVAIVLFSLLALVSAWSDRPTLEPLAPTTWTLTPSTNDKDVPVAMALRANGTRLNVNFPDVALSEQSYYTDPLSCAAAGLTAIIDMKESWWGDLVAKAAKRGTDGEPLPEYTPDSGQNLYVAYTYHTKNPRFPRPVDADVVTYLRVGGMHGFEVEWAEVAGEMELPAQRSVIAVQEFAPGKYRMAPEWMSPAATVRPLLENTNFRDPDLEAHRTAKPPLNHEVELKGLFGSTDGAYPLTLLFRATASDKDPAFARVKARKERSSR